ncbi:MAG TPA: hypothetical protein VL688_12270 [Verrucomicrobiae bacterium]|jgi:hypothetical protein|nr:hypothetical protein [Verrucomicrobiae bacterium]
MPFAETMTAATDYLLAALCFFWAARLRWSFQDGFRARLFWALLFAASGLAAVTGGTHHALAARSGASPDLLWKLTLSSILFASFCLVAAAAFSWTRGPWRFFLLGLAVLKTVFFAMKVGNDPVFKWAVLDYASAMLLTLAVAGAARGRGTGMIAGGILISFAAAYLQQSKIGMGELLNYNVLYHLIQMAAFYLFFRGARSASEAAPAGDSRAGT